MENIKEHSILDRITSDEVFITVGVGITLAVIYFKTKNLCNKKKGFVSQEKIYRVDGTGSRSHYAYLSSLNQVKLT